MTGLKLLQAETKLIVSADSFIVLAATEGALHLLEATPHNLLGRSLLQWILPSEREDFRKTLKVSGRHAHPVPLLVHWLSTSGQPIKLETCSRERQDEHQTAYLEIQITANSTLAPVGLRKEIDAPLFEEPFSAPAMPLALVGSSR
jgi:hypothetical protein